MENMTAVDDMAILTDCDSEGELSRKKYIATIAHVNATVMFCVKIALSTNLKRGMESTIDPSHAPRKITAEQLSSPYTAIS